ncbi:hypothetical protein HHK36_030518 [Tetracentron sinense]|uniref:Uncharacterized protein n=1 Tax=Tetracentron sinense TaxID=13715 RepID=A0A834YCN9_TETSI|nr:hypothetical protein HHK36_030518 [Tetracentron sinense]
MGSLNPSLFFFSVVLLQLAHYLATNPRHLGVSDLGSSKLDHLDIRPSWYLSMKTGSPALVWCFSNTRVLVYLSISLGEDWFYSIPELLQSSCKVYVRRSQATAPITLPPDASISSTLSSSVRLHVSNIPLADLIAISDFRTPGLSLYTSTQSHRSKVVSAKVTALERFRVLVWNLLKRFGIQQIFDRKLMNTEALQLLSCICKEISPFDASQLKEIRAHSALMDSIMYGNTEFVVKIIKHCPILELVVDENGQNIFCAAILHRQEKIYNFLIGTGAQNNGTTVIRDKFDHNTMHLAGMLAPSSQLSRISGAALQMQRELQWFRVILSLNFLDF